MPVKEARKSWVPSKSQGTASLARATVPRHCKKQNVKGRASQFLRRNRASRKVLKLPTMLPHATGCLTRGVRSTGKLLARLSIEVCVGVIPGVWRWCHPLSRIPQLFNGTVTYRYLTRCHCRM